MFGKLGARQMEKMMKQMGVKSESIDATEVIIKTADKEIVVSEPQITEIEMKGERSFQVVGKVSERPLGSKFSDEDIKMITDQTGAGEEDAKKALEEEGDIAKAIMKLKA